MKHFIVILFALAVSASAVDLTLEWDAPVATETNGAASSYKLYRKTMANTWELVTPVILTQQTLSVTPGTYTFSVTAVNGGGESPRSNELTVTINPPAPGAPGAPGNLRRRIN